MASSEFEELRHQACQLTADIEMNSELPRVERSLYQLKDMAVKMASKAPVDDPNTKASVSKLSSSSIQILCFSNLIFILFTYFHHSLILTLQ